MGWQDRSYYRDSGRGSGNPLMWLLGGSIPLFTAFGIRVRMHVSLLFLLVFSLLTAESQHGMGWKNALTFDLTLFAIILLHEYGHCFAGRSVGGEARDILLWPLGGLAFVEAPNRAWPQFATAAGGPLVNVIICFFAAIGLGVVQHGWPDLPWNPWKMHFEPEGGVLGYAFWFVFIISWSLFLFNMMLPVYPMDCWRIVQTSLWFKLGFYRSMMIALPLGMIAAVLAGLWGLFNIGGWYGLALLIIAVNGFYWCYRNRTIMRSEGPWSYQEQDEMDYSASLFNPQHDHPKHRKLNKRLVKRAQKREAEEREEQDRVDQILAKVSAHGMHSLTWWERRALKRATERQRKRDLELHEEMGRKGF
jgi:stage IV sporulation protein FB